MEVWVPLEHDRLLRYVARDHIRPGRDPPFRIGGDVLVGHPFRYREGEWHRKNVEECAVGMLKTEDDRQLLVVRNDPLDAALQGLCESSGADEIRIEPDPGRVDVVQAFDCVLDVTRPYASVHRR